MNPHEQERKQQELSENKRQARSMENRKYDYIIKLKAPCYFSKTLISTVFQLYLLRWFQDRKQRPGLNDFTPSSISTHNICSGQATKVMRARTMIWLMNHLICSALSRSVHSDTVAINQSRHTYTFTHYPTHKHTHTQRQTYSSSSLQTF